MLSFKKLGALVKSDAPSYKKLNDFLKREDVVWSYTIGARYPSSSTVGIIKSSKIKSRDFSFIRDKALPASVACNLRIEPYEGCMLTNRSQQVRRLRQRCVSSSINAYYEIVAVM